MEHFGLEFLIGLPKWASFKDINSLVQKYISNLKGKNAKPYDREAKVEEKGDYLIRLLDPVKLRCIFCLQEAPYFNLKEDDLVPCCDAFEKEVPLQWSSKGKSYWVYVDWFNFNACNASFCSYIEMDVLSKRVQDSRSEEFINLEDCFKMMNEKEKV